MPLLSDRAVATPSLYHPGAEQEWIQVEQPAIRPPPEVPLDPEEEALLRGCLACPWDDAVFRVDADWLEEHQQTERADFVRRQVAQDGQGWSWGNVPESVRAWAARVFPAHWHQRAA